MTADGEQQRVWYAAYGSNLLAARFHTYLTGGPVPGATDGRTQEGARDTSLPSADQPIEIERTLLFALRSKRWGGGGIAFLDPDERPATPTLGRAWNVTLAQLADVYRQENRQSASPKIDLSDLTEQGRLDLFESTYGRLLHLGHMDGLPVLTFTMRVRPARLQPAHPAYLGVMADGLAESWELARHEAERYLASVPQAPVGSSGANL